MPRIKPENARVVLPGNDVLVPVVVLLYAAAQVMPPSSSRTTRGSLKVLSSSSLHAPHQDAPKSTNTARIAAGSAKTGSSTCTVGVRAATRRLTTRKPKRIKPAPSHSCFGESFDGASVSDIVALR